jgi:hypothetical protein
MPIGLRPRPRRAASFKRFLCAIPPNILLVPVFVATGPRKEISALHAKVSRNKYPQKARIGRFRAKIYAKDPVFGVLTVYFRGAAAATPRCRDGVGASASVPMNPNFKYFWLELEQSGFEPPRLPRTRSHQHLFSPGWLRIYSVAARPLGWMRALTPRADLAYLESSFRSHWRRGARGADLRGSPRCS